MAITIKTSDLEKTINQLIQNFETESIVKMKDATLEAAKFGKKEVASEAKKIPVGSGDYQHVGLVRTGKYAKSWTYKKVKETSYSIEYNVYSKKYYMLTHLLEYGHEKVLWGKVMKGERVRGYPHISVAEESTEKKFVEYVVTGMERYDTF